MYPTAGWQIRAIALLAAILALAYTSAASAQDVTGSLQGTVVSPEGKPEADVRVSASGLHLQGVRETTSDRNGFYQFLNLPPGAYTLRLGRIGSRPIEVRDIEVELGRTTAVPTLTLTSQPIPMDSVIVVAPAASLDPVHTTVGGVLKAEDYAALPVDRDYKSIITILPHANESYRGDPVNVAGSTGLENQYYIDGVNVTDARVGDRATSLPYNFVREVNVRTGGYEARYGRAMGAVVDAVTYSGTNRLEGNIFALAQPGALAMDPKATPVVSEQGSTIYDFGARVSGPLIRDRLWYSAAVNPRVSQVDKEISGHGSYPDKTTSVRFAGKLTWRASSTTNLEVSAFGDPTTQDVVIPPPLAGTTTIANPEVLLGTEGTGGVVASLRATVAPSPSLLLQAAVAGQWDEGSSKGATPLGRTEERYFDFVDGSMGGGWGADTSEKTGRTSLTAQGTLTMRRHTLIGGVNYETTRNHIEYDLLGVGVVARLDSTSYLAMDYFADGTLRNRAPALFVQDTWHVAPNIALNAGLRWSTQFLEGESGRTAQRTVDEWQPRAGFSWQPGGGWAYRIFGSYGRFYQTLPNAIGVISFVDWYGRNKYYSSDPRLPGAVPDTVMESSIYEADYKQVPELQAENFDEFTIGYERLVGERTTLTLRGIRRDLRSAYLSGADPLGMYVFGTPGKGSFDFLPPPKREYTALEVTAVGAWKQVRYRASYVLSRAWGNYTGLYSSDWGAVDSPGLNFSFTDPWHAENTTGLLPNDRTHVVKVSTALSAPLGVTVGAFLTLESGAPVNDLAASPAGRASPYFLVPRGTVGRTPALWNLDLRFSYDIPLSWAQRTRLQLDVLQIGNPRETTWVEEVHYLSVDENGNPTDPNPQYRQPKAHQSPMAARLGVELSF